MTMHDNAKKFRRSICVLLSCACCCFLAACTEQEETDNSEKNSTSDKVQLTEDLTVSPYSEDTLIVSGEEPVQLSDGCYVSSQVYAELDQDSYDLSENSRFHLTMHNETGETLSTGDDFELEILLDDVWYVVPPMCAFTDVATVNIHETDTYGYDLSEIDVEFISGTYRVLKTYTGEESYLVSAQFQLTV